MPAEDVVLGVLIFAAAVLYACVGHAGASGYLAAMALVGLSPEVMKPTALTLNVLVATIGTVKYYRAGAFSWRLFWPFALASTPFAYLGGSMSLPAYLYQPLVGAVLIYAAWYSFHSANREQEPPRSRAPMVFLLMAGAALGLLSGLTGVGGGIFLSPLLLLFRWAEVRVISGIAAAFILVNSLAGLLGVMATAPALPAALPYWAIAAVVGGYIGAELGSRRMPNPRIRQALALVLLVAGAKMVWTAFA